MLKFSISSHTYVNQFSHANTYWKWSKFKKGTFLSTTNFAIWNSIIKESFLFQNSYINLCFIRTLTRPNESGKWYTYVPTQPKPDFSYPNPNHHYTSHTWNSCLVSFWFQRHQSSFQLISTNSWSSNKHDRSEYSGPWK